MDEAAIVTLTLRLLVPLLILRFPLTGILLSALVDVTDYSFLGSAVNYQQLDKLLDTYYLSLAAITVLRWKDGLAKRIALGAYAWRVLGVLLVLLTDQRWLLMVFPNFFEPLFVFYLLYVYLSKNTKLFTSGWIIAAITVTLLIPKLVQEYVLHIYQPSPESAPAWTTFLIDNLAWTAIPLYILPPIIVLIVCIIQARRRVMSRGT
jgi:hypothetical protein